VPQVGAATANRIWELIAGAPDPLAVAIRGGADTAAPRRGSGWTEFRTLLETLAADDARQQPGRQIELVLARGYESFLAATYENAEARLEDLRQLARYSARFNSTEEFLAELALISTERYSAPQPVAGEDTVMGGDEDELLTLTSVHQAKGLEWRAVFIIWAADGKFPSPRSLRDAEGEEEERRLWYVALTRARDQLYITYPLIVSDYNRQTVVQRPSRFVTEVAPALYEIWELTEETLAAPPATAAAALNAATSAIEETNDDDDEESKDADDYVN
jgi:DNA helicase-2/ATP-dependent DNA helicase PcrA